MNGPPELLSIVIPVFDERDNLDELLRRLNGLQHSLPPNIDIEFIFVDDGSSDGSTGRLREEAGLDARVKVISLSRNFGHQVAITAGIDHARGDYVAVIDADLQDPPELIAEMLRKAREGFEVVYGQRRSRVGESVFKKATAAGFYRIFGFMCETEIPVDTGDFRLMTRKAADAFRALRERHRFVRGLVPWIGFRSAPVLYDRQKRFAGKTKYPLKKMVAFATNAILSFSSKPLTLAIRLGLLTILAGLIGGAYMLYLKLFTNLPVPGVTAILLSIVIFSGMQILLIGLIGAYIARIFEEVKGRPMYVISEKINL